MLSHLKNACFEYCVRLAGVDESTQMIHRRGCHLDRFVYLAIQEFARLPFFGISRIAEQEPDTTGNRNTHPAFPALSDGVEI
jgi:hypothetical protein